MRKARGFPGRVPRPVLGPCPTSTNGAAPGCAHRHARYHGRAVRSGAVALRTGPVAPSRPCAAAADASWRSGADGGTLFEPTTDQGRRLAALSHRLRVLHTELADQSQDMRSEQLRDE